MPAPDNPIRRIDLAGARAIHIVGIGGAGMRAIARVLLAMGHQVTGSDRTPSPYLDELTNLGAGVHVGHAPEVMTQVEMVTRSTAVPDSDPEIAAAIGRGIDVYSRAEMLAAITSQRPGILIAGTHGKTTTASILAVVLDHAGRNPSFVIGSDVERFGSGARWTDSDLFVVEADESDGTFLTLPGSHAVVTSLDPDHLDYYGSVDNLEDAFVAFVDGIEGSTAVCLDDPDTTPLLGRAGVVTYGTDTASDLRIDDVVVGADSTSFEVFWHGEPLGRAQVGLPGHHNALNAAGATAVALSLGLSFADIAAGLASFAGVARRFENRGEHSGVRFIDDYAHLPAEVEAAISTAKQGPWNRVIAAYQPHRFSRTEALGATFATAFKGVDDLVLTDIYPAGEEPRPGVTGRIVVDAVVEACPEMRVHWEPTVDDVANHLANAVGPGDLCLTLGAGDLTRVADEVLQRLRARSAVSVDWLTDIAGALPDTEVFYNEPVGPRTTYRVGGAALALAEVGSDRDLEHLVRAAIDNETPILALGKGSNMLVADQGFLGLVVVLTGQFDQIAVDDLSVTLGAATSLPVAARRLATLERTGFEWAVGVPGTVGGAVAMNAGGHGSDMAASVRHARVMDLRTSQVTTRSAAQLDFGYRSSSVGPHDLVLDATLDLAVGEVDRANTELSEIVRWRRDNQPGGQNAGSVFTNPPNDSAGRLIDHAGGKGLRIGTAEVSDKHANFIQADPDGRAADIFALMHRVIALVHDHAGVELEPETRLVGFSS